MLIPRLPPHVGICDLPCDQIKRTLAKAKNHRIDFFSPKLENTFEMYFQELVKINHLILVMCS